jgi:hypothetical protein
MLRESQVYLYPDKIDQLAELTAKMREVHDQHVKQLESKQITAKEYLGRMGANNEVFMSQTKILLGQHDFDKLFGGVTELPIDEALFLSINHESRLGRFYYWAKHELGAKLYLIRHLLKRATSRHTTAGP